MNEDKYVKVRYAFTVTGDIRAKERPRHKQGEHSYTPERTVFYENQVREAWYKAFNDFNNGSSQNPFTLKIEMFFRRPMSQYKSDRKTLRYTGSNPAPEICVKVRIDTDNVTKIIKDALNRVAYYDDGYIFSESITRYYIDHWEQEYVNIELIEIKRKEA